jgi:hypothetical protein
MMTKFRADFHLHTLLEWLKAPAVHPLQLMLTFMSYSRGASSEPTACHHMEPRIGIE